MPERRESQALVRAVLQERAAIQFLPEQHESQPLARAEPPEPDEIRSWFQVELPVLPERHESLALQLVLAWFPALLLISTRS